MGRMTPVALGFRAHSGWAAVVAIAGPPGAPDAVDRGRVDLLDRTIPGAAQPYHAAAEMELKQAEKLIDRCVQSARRLAAKGLRDLIANLREKNYEPVACGILLASGRPLGTLESVLASHALIHTAEGELFRDALAHASQECALPVTRVRERDLLTELRAKVGVTEDHVKAHLAQLGRRMGPPWRQDEKTATLAACLALHGAGKLPTQNAKA
jgi:hypothetical protein